MRNHIYIACSIYLIVACSSSTKAQTITILNQSTHEPIENVLVSNKRTKAELFSAENGSFNAENYLGQDSIIFRHPNFITKTFQFNDLLLNDGRVYLAERPITTQAVVITAKPIRDYVNRPIPYQSLVLDRSFLQFQNPQTMADGLIQSGQVWVQKSQQGGGSPVLRGFEANKVLLIVDGIRMNNAIYRGGHLQSIITVDNLSLERAEVVYGPGSVLYGSDALGGVIHMRTKQPQLATAEHTNNFRLNALSRYATVNQEKTLHLDMNVGGKMLASWTSFTFSDFGDLRTGNIRLEKYPHFGQRKEYIQRIEGKDQIITNSNPNLQVGSGYKQYDFIQKVLFQPSTRFKQTLNLQLSTSTDIPRYDRLTDRRNGRLRFAEWYYGPQLRVLAALHNDWQANSVLFDDLNFVAGYQYIEESRYNRNFNDPNRAAREERLHLVTLNVNATKKLATNHYLQYGAEWNYNRVLSNAYNLNIETQQSKPLDTRYPDGGSDMNLGGLYLTHRWNIASEKLFFEEGLRLSYTQLKSKFISKQFFPFLPDVSEQTNLAVNGMLGITWLPVPTFKVGIVGSTGFRAPNVDDMGKVFESTPGNVIMPNPNLKPEYTYNAELNIEKRFNKTVIFSTNVYYSQFRGIIQAGITQMNGKDSILYDGVLSRVQMNMNTGKAYLYGAAAKLDINFLRYLYFNQTVGYTYGRDFDNIPLDHIAPLFGRTALGYKCGAWQIESYLLFNGWKKIENMRPTGEDNPQYGTPEGYPAWFTLNLKTSWQFSPHGSIQCGVENILDHHYRYFASGVSAAGRNLFITLRGNF